MANAQRAGVLNRVRAAAVAGCARAAGDRQLLDRFLAARDQSAFAELIRRHGPRVLRVCRLVLGQEQDAEDAFQVTFLLLAKNAASVHTKEALSGWLHGVAHRTALAARRAAARRRRHEGQAHAMTPTNPSAELAWGEVQAVLAEEVQRLPDVYRSAFMLCCLEGRSQAEAACELGLKEGTVSSRLNRARARLRERLARRGIELSAVLGAAFVAQAGAAAVPAALARTTAAAASRYAAGAGLGESVPASAAALLRSMARTTLLGQARVSGLLVVTFCALVTGAGLCGHQGGPDASQRAAPGRPDAADGEKAEADALPAGAVVRLGSVRLRHGAPVWAVAFSPDGKQIASAGGSQRAGYGDPTASLWNAASGRELRRFRGHRLPVSCVSFSPDGKRLATGSHDGTVRLWDPATGKELRRLEGRQAITAIAFSADGKLLASAGADMIVRVWITASGKERERLIGIHRNVITGLAFTPRGETLVVASADGTVRVWNFETGQTPPLVQYQQAVTGIALSPDGKTLASAGGAVAMVWEMPGGKRLHTLAGHGREVLCVAFSADGKTLASGDENGGVRLWNVATGKERGRLTGHRGRVLGLAFSPDGKSLASGGADHTVRLWDVATGKERLPSAGHHTYVGVLAFSADGSRLATAGQDGTVRAWETATGKEREHFPGRQTRGKAVAFTADGKLLAAGTHNGTVRLLEADSGREVRQFGRHRGQVITVAFSPDGKHLASAGYDRTIRLWDWHAGKQVRAWLAHEGSIAALAFSADGALAASGSNDGSLAVWRVATGEPVHRMRGRAPAVETVAFSPDGGLLASGGQEPLIRLWSVRSGKEVAQLGLPGPGWVNNVAFSADGRALAANNPSGPGVIVWEVVTRKERCRFAGHRGAVVSVAFAPDGLRLASGSADGTALLWDLSGAAAEPSPRELAAAWEDLGDADAARAYRAIRALVAARGRAVELLRRRVRPAPAVDGKRFAEAVKDLGHARFSERERAMRELEKLGPAVEPGLRSVLENPPSLEVRRRVAHVLDQLAGVVPPPEQVRELRALEVLERLGNPEARGLLEALARGAPEARLTQEARASWQRLNGSTKGHEGARRKKR